MEEIIKGKAYVLGENIDTDQIIPAKHLVYSLSHPEERKLYGKYALSGVPEAKAGLPQGNVRFVEDDNDRSVYRIIVAGKNFGCGSSREHAPVCLNIAGLQAVVAPSYARIFYRNAVDGGFFIPFESFEDLSQTIRTGDELEIRVKEEKLTDHTTRKTHRLRPLGDVADILKAGDVFAYARKAGLIKNSAGGSAGTSPESFRMSED
jgi:3-isopropylmalate/(R)-2-methylmalate dehydratase small subunit